MRNNGQNHVTRSCNILEMAHETKQKLHYHAVSTISVYYFSVVATVLFEVV